MISSLITIIFKLKIPALITALACTPSNDPIAKVDAIYDDIIRILRSPPDETNDQQKRINDLLEAKQSEILNIQRQLKEELSRLNKDEERKLFLKRFDGFLARVREIQTLVRAKGLDF